MEERENKKNKKTVLDLSVAAIAVIGIIICLLFKGCKLDIIVAIIGFVVIAAGATLLAMQNKRINKLYEEQ